MTELGIRTTGRRPRRPEQVAAVAAEVAAGRIAVFTAAVFPLERAREAYELLETGHAGGNVVLEVRPA